MSGVSRSMVSQIERGESSPTIATLWNLTRALQVDFAGLLEPNSGPKVIEVMPASQAPTIEKTDDGISILILSQPEMVGKSEVYDLRFKAGSVLASQPHAQGAREQLTVIEGMLTVTSGEAVETLNGGDTARYAADIAHKIAAGDQPVRAFLVVHYA